MRDAIICTYIFIKVIHIAKLIIFLLIYTIILTSRIIYFKNVHNSDNKYNYIILLILLLFTKNIYIYIYLYLSLKKEKIFERWMGILVISQAK